MKKILLLSFAFFMSGCLAPTIQPTPLPPKTAPLISPTHTQTPLPSPSPTPTLVQPTATATQMTPTVIPSPSAPASPPESHPSRTQYDLDVLFNYENHFLSVTQTITYVNRLEEPLADLILVINPNQRSGIFTLTDLHWGNGLPIKDFILEKTRLLIPIPDSLRPSDFIVCILSFELTLPNQNGTLGYTDKEALLIDWYPFIPPYEPGKGWVANKPWPYGEYLAYDVADYQVHIQLEGIPANSKKGPQIAAGVPGEIQGDRHFFQLRNARSFAWSASPNYQMQTMEKGGITLQGYIYPEHQTAGDAALKNVADALVLFSQLFGPYPRESFTIVEADFSDGREYDGLIFLSADYHAEYNDSPKNFLTLLSVHETSHQWWYGLIGNNQAEEPWIDEALATYSELLFYENYYPELVEWWWQFRVNYFRPQGYINRSIYDYERFLPYVHGVYLRGALFIQELRDAMGDQAFFSFLADYVAQSANQYISAKDFFTLLTANSQVDLEPILDKYFDQP